MGDDQKITKRWSIILTVFYGLLFPATALFAFYMGRIFSSPETPFLFTISVTFLLFLVPLSLLVTIYLIWSNYTHRKYNSLRFVWPIPFITFTFVVLMVMGVEKLFR